MSHAAFDELMKLVSYPQPLADEIELRGEDPALPTRFRIGTAASAAIGACAVAASRLWAMRGEQRRRQIISVDLRHAAAALRSTRYLRIDGAPAKDGFDPLSGLYQARDQRWVFLHCNFANHRAAALGVLGLPSEVDRDAVARAVAKWDGLALEESVHAARGCAALVRARREWLQHPQSKAVASLPLLEIERFANAPPEPLPSAERPLSGIRVLDLTRVLAGPTCARTLAEHGADVLKVSAPHLPHSGQIEIDTGLGKLSAFLDLRGGADAEILASLVREGRCDVFSQSYRPGSLVARGFGPQRLSDLRPGIVCVELSAWGRAGPWSRRRGFDTVTQCVSGMAMIQGADETPRMMPASALDYLSGYLLAFGVMVALERRAREGGSWLVRGSLARAAQWIFDLGLLDASAIANVSKELPDEELARMSAQTASPWGVVRHLAPVARMSHTPPRWDRPPVPLGHDDPVWPAQSSSLGP